MDYTEKTLISNLKLHSDLINIFLEQAEYETSPKNNPKIFSAFPSIFFYGHMALTVLKAGLIAKLGKYTAIEWIKSSLEIFKAIEKIGGKITINGLNYLQTYKEPCVIIANHMSTLETFILPCIIQPNKDVTFVVKQSLINYPCFGSVLKSRNPIVVLRKNARQDLATVLNEGVKKLQAGTSIIVFPQSTRSYELDLNLFNSIGIKLAKKANVAVIPLALNTKVWGIGKFIKDFGKINLEHKINFIFGKPIYIQGNGKKEHEQVINFINNNLLEWVEKK